MWINKRTERTVSMTKAAAKRKSTTQTAQASLSRRFFAYLIDWYVGGLATALPVAFFSMRQYQTVQNQNIMQFSAPYGVIAGILALICAVLYYAVIPAWGWKGQTPGKRLLHLKIVQADGTDVTPGTIFLRQLVGIIVLEGGLVTASTIWHQVATLLTGVELVKPLMYVGMVVSVISAVLVITRNHTAIHDRLAGTQVVQQQA